MKSKSLITTAALILLCTTQLADAQWWKRQASPDIHLDTFDYLGIFSAGANKLRSTSKSIADR